MKINNKEFKDWTEGDLQEIVENDAFRENDYLDYKQTFAVLECQDKESKRKNRMNFAMTFVHLLMLKVGILL